MSNRPRIVGDLPVKPRIMTADAFENQKKTAAEIEAEDNKPKIRATTPMKTGPLWFVKRA
jgi:hypothetical protein